MCHCPLLQLLFLHLHHHSFTWHCIVLVNLRWTTSELCSLLILKQSLWLKIFDWLSGTNLTPCFDIPIQDGVSKQGTDAIMNHCCIFLLHSLSLRDCRTHFPPQYLSSAWPESPRQAIHSPFDRLVNHPVSYSSMGVQIRHLEHVWQRKHVWVAC